MRQISPKEFTAAFLAVVEEERSDIAVRWAGPRADYTRFMRTVVLTKVGERLGLKTYCSDYYTLDAIFYEDKDVEHFPADHTYAKYVAVALEHENVVTTSCTEMNKLQLFNAPLKVLITYAPGSDMENSLAKYAKIVRNADCFGDIATLRRQVVLFGDMSQNAQIWRSFVYEGEGFVPLTVA
jgi:hypothetical protein